MTHIGVICTPVSGHLNPMSALGRELKQRGYSVTFFQMPDVEAKVRSEGLDFWRIGESDHPLGSLPQSVAQLGKLSDLAALRFTVNAIARTTAMICRDAPQAIRAAKVDFLLVDQQEPAGASVAEFLGIPFATICNALPINREAAIPPFFTPWNYQTNWRACWRNHAGYSLFDWVTQPINQVLSDYRRQWHLPIYRNPDDYSSSLAQISQLTADFDFPRSNASCFHYAGSFQNPSPKAIPFPYEKLNGQPLIYASLGTLQNRRREIFETIATACAGLDAQLVISLGGGSQAEHFQNLPGHPLVVNYAPQVELLAQTTLTITHAGLNTTLESLSQGVPMVAIPITNDQPGVASRIEWSGSGKRLSLSSLNSQQLRSAILQVLTDNRFKQKATALKVSLKQAGGAKRAVDIIEQVIRTGKPALPKL